MKKKLKTLIWLAVALLALAFLILRTPADQLQSTFQQVRWPWIFGAIALYFIAQTLLASRWVLLLRIQKVHISLFQAVKLTYLGLFYNNMMPGAVGGDLLKAWYITHHSPKDNKVEAAVTVFLDRVVGLIGMILVAAIASFTSGGSLPINIFGRTFAVRHLIWGLFLILIITGILFFSRRLRRNLMLSRLLEKLPFNQILHKIDQAIQLYRHHIPTMFASLGLTAVIQGLSIVAIWMLSQAVHLDKVSLWHCLMIMPIVWLISAAVPVPGGLGVMENLFMPFFVAAAAPPTALTPEQDAALRASVTALALLNRLMICVCSLPGALVPIFGSHLPKQSELVKEISED